MDSVTLVPTESMQRIFIPLWNRITELVIVTSEDCGLHQSNQSGSLINPLLSMSEDIIRCLKDLSMVSKQTVSLRYPEDAVVKQEVDFCSQNMMMAGESLVLGCHIMCSTKKSDIHIKSPVPQKMDVCGCLSDLYQCMVLLLLAIDDAEVRKIMNLGLAATKALTSLVAANSLQSINDHFRSLAVPVANFYNLAVIRCDDVSDRELQHELQCAIATLRQSLPMLSASLQMAIKYPDKQKSLKGRDYCVHQVHKAILEINKKIAQKIVRKSSIYGLNCGLFHERLFSIKDFVKPEKRNDLNLHGLSYVLQSFIQHALELALSLPKVDIEAKNTHKELVLCCRKMIKSDRKLESTYSDHDSSRKIWNDQINEQCIHLIATSEGTMIPVTDAVVVLVVNTFVLMDKPLLDLVEVCIHPEISFMDDTENTSQQKVRHELKVEELTEKYLQYIDNIKRTTKFSASCCKDSSIYKKYNKNLQCFDDVSKAVTIAISEYQERHVQNDLLRNDQIMDIKERWLIAFYDIIQLVALSLDLKCLLDYILKNTTTLIEKCSEGVVNLDSNKTAVNLHKATGLAVLLEKVGVAIVSNSTLPVYRNGVLSHVKKLNSNVSNATAFGNELLEDVGRIEQQDLFTATLKNLLECMQAVSNAILYDDNHPELTSISRQNIRTEKPSQSILSSDLLHFSSDEESNRYKFGITDNQSESQINDGDSGTVPSDTSAMLKPTNLIAGNLISCLVEACSNDSMADNLESAKKLFSEACDLNMEISRNTLVESTLDKPSKQKQFVLKKSSEVIESLGNLIPKEIDRIMEIEWNKQPGITEDSDDLVSLNILAAQWSQASLKITNQCMAVLPLYVIPIRRYCVYFLDALTEDQKSAITKSLVPYPGYKSILLENMMSIVSSQEWDDMSFTDFNVHEKNVGELIRLINAISDLIPSEVHSDKHQEISDLCDTIYSSWEKSCTTKEKIQQLIEKISSGHDGLTDKAMLHLQCLSWSSKIHMLHVDILKAAKLLLLEFEIKTEEFALIPVIFSANTTKTTEMAQYVHMLSTLLECHGTCNLGRDSLTATWSDNLKLTKEVIEEQFTYLSSIRSSVPLVFHHGHSMFHLVHLHHLFYAMLAYLILAKTQEKRHLSEFGDRPSLSARLKSLKEDRERQNDSLNELLQTVPKLEF